MKKTILFLIFFTSTYIGAQNIFYKPFPYFSNSQGYKLEKVNDGGYIIIGKSASQNSYSNILLIKCDEQGDTIWSKKYGTLHNDIGFAIKQTYDNGFVIAGQIGKPDTTSENLSKVYILKTDSYGDSLWSYQWNPETGDRAFDIIETIDSNFLAVGVIGASVNFSSPKAFQMLLNASGDTIWTKTYENQTAFNSIIKTLDGGYFIGGSSGVSITSEVFLVKLNSNGDTLWTKKGGIGFSYGIANEVIQLSDGTFIVTGSRFNNPNQNAFISKLDINGNLIWTNEFGGSGNDFLKSVDTTSDGGFILCGSTSSFSQGQYTNSDIWLLRMDHLGDTLWTKTYGTLQNDAAYSVKTSNDGGFVLTGFEKIPINAFILKTDSLGFSTVSTPESHQELEEIKVFPNPVLNEIRVIFNSVVEFSAIELSIVDLIGNKIKCEYVEYNNSIIINTEKLASGLYIISFKTQDFVFSKKFLKI